MGGAGATKSQGTSQRTMTNLQAASLLLLASLLGNEEQTPSAPSRQAPLEAVMIAGGNLHLMILDERVEVITPYGRLSVPVGDIERLELALPMTEDMLARIDKDIRDLGAEEFDKREAASADLLALQERAIPALLKAIENPDAEVAQRAEKLVDMLADALPEDRFSCLDKDVLHTRDSKFAGKLAVDSLRVLTPQFGEQRLRLADVRTLRRPEAVGEETRNALPDPGTLRAFQQMVGKTLTFKVDANATGKVWGTDMYTLDTALAAAAVHAGVLKAGKSGTVRVTILGPQAAFAGSLRNGVQSSEYGAYDGAFRFARRGRR